MSGILCFSCSLYYLLASSLVSSFMTTTFITSHKYNGPPLVRLPLKALRDPCHCTQELLADTVPFFIGVCVDSCDLLVLTHANINISLSLIFLDRPDLPVDCNPFLFSILFCTLNSSFRAKPQILMILRPLTFHWSQCTLCFVFIILSVDFCQFVCRFFPAIFLHLP